jgi:hypothetical protein
VSRPKRLHDMTPEEYAAYRATLKTAEDFEAALERWRRELLEAHAEGDVEATLTLQHHDDRARAARAWVADHREN